MGDICNEFIDNRNCVRRDCCDDRGGCCDHDHREFDRFDLDCDRKRTMQLCEFIESLKEIKYALKHAKMGEKDIYEGICEFEKGLHDVREGLCEIEKCEKDICDALKCVEEGLADLLRERF